jgi:TRAP-type C4-dicarboxylate transport system permease small subunit
MLSFYRRAMDLLYRACVLVAGSAMVSISVIVPWGVFTRYVLNSASSWPEPAAILLSIVLTFFGAAACYRVRSHMRVSFVRDRMPPLLRRAADTLAELLMASVGVYMAVWGYSLCEATWHQSIDAFPALSVGATYLPIPIGGVCLLLFAVEHLSIGAPPDRLGDARALAPFD